MNTLLPPLLKPNQLGKLNYRDSALVVRGPGVLNSAVTWNPDNVSGSAALYDLASVTDIPAGFDGVNVIPGADPIATIAANTASAELDIPFTHGLVIAASPWQVVSVAIQPAATAVFP